MRFTLLLPRLMTDECGAASVEYGLIGALIVVGLLTAMTSLASETRNTWSIVASKTHDSVQQATGG